MEIITADENSVETFADVLIKSAEWLNLIGKPMWKTDDLTVEELLKKCRLQEMKLCYDNVSESKEAIQLRGLFKKIQEIIESKEEYKKLPEAKGGYD
jgi:predicted RNA-binding protein with EMAP domain